MPDLIRTVARPVRRLLNAAGLDVVRRATPAPPPELPPDFDEADAAVHEETRAFTMTSAERVYMLRRATEHIVRRSIEGAIVECGVWRGGSMMVVARTLLELGNTERDLYLFDTYEGMPPPTEDDVMYTGASATELMEWQQPGSRILAEASLDEVRTNVLSVGYPEERIHFVPGLVEDTIPEQAPAVIALLRLDTDWYESTRHELEHLYPRLAVGGPLIIDDYGHWAGARKAVDEYFSTRPAPLFSRIDYTARIAVKEA
jgi:hypothetical protein